MFGDITGCSSRTGYNDNVHRGVRFAAAAALSSAFGLILGCAGDTPIKPAEVLDERTGMTVGALHKPIELVQSTESMPSAGQRVSFAYLGPDRMGQYGGHPLRAVDPSGTRQ